MVYHLKADKYISAKTGCGYSRFASKREVCFLHDHEFYEFVLVLSGNVTHEYNGKTKVLKKGSLMLIRPKDIHRFSGENGEEFSYENIAFPEEVFDEVMSFLKADEYARLFRESPEPPVILLDESQTIRLNNSFSVLMGEGLIPEPAIYSRGVIASVISKYFINKEHRTEENEIPKWFTMLCNEMQKKENFSAGVERMTELSGKSYGYMGHCFKKFLDTTPTMYINDLRLEYAGNLLTHSNIPIIDISEELGYNNLGYFYGEFKKKYGMSPAKYRKQKRSQTVL